MVSYKGFQIVIAQVLGSGQTTYKIEGIETSVVDRLGRTTQTTITEAKIIIDKFLGEYVAPAVTEPLKMSQEMFDQLQAGTVALQDNKILQATVDQLTAGVQTIQQDILAIDNGQLDALRAQIQLETQRLADIRVQIGDTRTEVVDSLSGTLQGLKDQFDDLAARITANTGDVTDYTASLNESKESIVNSFKSFGDSINKYQESLDSVLADLKQAQGMGFLKQVPLIVGAGLAVILGIKVMEAVD